MLKIGQNWGKIANYPPNAQERSAPLLMTPILSFDSCTLLWKISPNPTPLCIFDK